MENKIISGLEENSLKLMDLDLIKGNSNSSSFLLSVIEILCKSINCIDKREYAKLTDYDDHRISFMSRKNDEITKNTTLLSYYSKFISGTFDEKIALAIINLLVFAVEYDIQIDRIINLYIENENIKKNKG